MSLGNVNGRYFLFHVGLGFDAAVVERVERRGALKRYAGHALFVSATFSTWLRHYDRSRPAFSLRIGTETVEGYFGICLKTDPYTYFGERPLSIAPATGLDTGLTIVTFRSLDLLTFLPLAGAALGQRRRGLAGRRGVSVVADVQQVVVEAHRELPYQADGDYLGQACHFELRCDPAALRLILPSS